MYSQLLLKNNIESTIRFGQMLLKAKIVAVICIIKWSLMQKVSTDCALKPGLNQVTTKYKLQLQLHTGYLPS